MEQRYRYQPPADDQHRVSHVRGAAVDNQVDYQQKAEKGSDDQRSPNDWAPMRRGFETTEEYFDSSSSSSITVFHPLQLDGKCPCSLRVRASSSRLGRTSSCCPRLRRSMHPMRRCRIASRVF